MSTPIPNGAAIPKPFKPSEDSADKVMELSKQANKNGNGNHMKRHKQPQKKEPKAAILAQILKNHFYLFDDGDYHLIQKEHINKYAKFDINHINFYKKQDAIKTVVRKVFKIHTRQTVGDELLKEEINRFKVEAYPYHEIGFDPKGKRPNVINTFPKEFNTVYKGDEKSLELFNFPKTKSYLLNVICGGDKELYGYLIKFLAHAIQKPWEKPKVMLIFKSIEEGTGKGRFHHLLQLIFGKIAYMVTNINSVFQYGDVLMRTYFLIFDEFNELTAPKIADQLKSLITEELISARKIYGAEIPIPSAHRFMAFTNKDRPANTSKTNRRLIFFPVSSIQMDNHDYFKELHDAWADGEVEEFVGYLQRLDISDFVPYSKHCKPNNKEMDEQKIGSLTGLDKLLFDIADQGLIPEIIQDEETNKPKINNDYYLLDGSHITIKRIHGLLTSRLTKAYQVFDNDRHWSYKRINQELEQAGILYKRFANARGFLFPDFQTFRDLVRKHLGLSENHEWSVDYDELQDEIQDNLCQKVTDK